MAKEFSLGNKQYATYPNFPGATGLSYRDVMLVPQASDVESRTHVDTSIRFGPFDLKVPVISAPMDTISGDKMIRALASVGALGTIPRGPIDQVARQCRTYADENIPFIASIGGLRKGVDHIVHEAQVLKDNGAQFVIVDVANGGMTHLMRAAVEVKKLGMYVGAGNIATNELAERYLKEGIDYPRVGVGPGGLCETRQVAGTGYPQLSAIMETSLPGLFVIADGGVQEPGDVAKAIAAGATAVMIGSYFGKTYETPGEVGPDGMKEVRGQASDSFMKDNGVISGEHRAAEGASVRVKPDISVIELVNRVSGGLRSALSYAGALNISDFRDKSKFVIGSAGTMMQESPAWMKNQGGHAMTVREYVPKR